MTMLTSTNTSMIPLKDLSIVVILFNSGTPWKLTFLHPGIIMLTMMRIPALSFRDIVSALFVIV